MFEVDNDLIRMQNDLNINNHKLNQEIARLCQEWQPFYDLIYNYWMHKPGSSMNINNNYIPVVYSYKDYYITRDAFDVEIYKKTFIKKKFKILEKYIQIVKLYTSTVSFKNIITHINFDSTYLPDMQDLYANMVVDYKKLLEEKINKSVQQTAELQLISNIF